MSPIRKWARRWVYTASQFLASILALVYVVIFIASMLLMVLVVGLLTARVVLPMARVLANWSLAAAHWVRDRGELATIPARPDAAARPDDLGRPATGGLTSVVTALLRSALTWRSALFLLVNAIALPFSLAAMILAPVAGQWARAHAWFTVWLLAPASLSLVTPAGPALGSGPGWVHRGFGLIGMSERVAALGGRLETGPTPDGGFEVRAVLPLGTPIADNRGGAPGGDSRPPGGAVLPR
jgi:hypothetical protein